jgi:hypothetical protein
MERVVPRPAVFGIDPEVSRRHPARLPAGDDETGKGRREIGSTVVQRFLARKKTVEARV